MSDKFIPLTENFWVSPQIDKNDIAEAAEAGVKLIINNRPDGEMLGQPKSNELEAAAKAAGMAYAYIPVSGGLRPDQLAAFSEATSKTKGLTLAFCRSGTRSTMLRSYASALAGMSAHQLVAEAAAAGYDISQHLPMLQSLNDAAQSPRPE